MKKILLFPLALLLSLVYACTDVETIMDQVKEVPSEVELIPGYNFTPFNLPFPEGTYFNIEEHDMYFQLPETHYVVGLEENGSFYSSSLAGEGSITCECTEGSGCNPTSLPKGKQGCFMADGCNTCKKEPKSIAGEQKPFVDLIICDTKVDLYIEDFDDLEGQYLLPPAFLNYAPIKEILKDIQSKTAHARTKETTVVFAKIFGYILPIEVPKTIENTAIQAMESGLAGDGSAKITCKCNVGSDPDKCPKKDYLVATWCDASNCTNCTLNSRVVNTNGDVRLLTAKTGGKITLQ